MTMLTLLRLARRVARAARRLGLWLRIQALLLREQQLRALLHSYAIRPTPGNGPRVAWLLTRCSELRCEAAALRMQLESLRRHA